MSDHVPRFIAAVSLILMAVSALIAHILLMPRVRENPIESAELWLSIGLFLLVIIIDVIVAWALYRVFMPFSQRGATIAALLRLLYAFIFFLAVTRLVAVNVRHFDALWDIGLVIFGIHLMVLGVISVKQEESGPLRWVGVLLLVAGLGHVFDSVVALVGFALGMEASTVTFIGEAALILWLLGSVFASRSSGGVRGERVV